MVRYFTYMEGGSHKGARDYICGRYQEEGVPYHVTTDFRDVTSTAIKGEEDVQFLLSGRFTKRTFSSFAIFARLSGTIVLFNYSIHRKLRPVYMIDGIRQLHPTFRTINGRINCFAISEYAFFSDISCHFVDFFKGVLLRLLTIRRVTTVVVERFIKEDNRFREFPIKGLL